LFLGTVRFLWQASGTLEVAKVREGSLQVGLALIASEPSFICFLCIEILKNKVSCWKPVNNIKIATWPYLFSSLSTLSLIHLPPLSHLLGTPGTYHSILLTWVFPLPGMSTPFHQPWPSGKLELSLRSQFWSYLLLSLFHQTLLFFFLCFLYRS
jgi:hypothetical protein